MKFVDNHKYTFKQVITTVHLCNLCWKFRSYMFNIMNQ